MKKLFFILVFAFSIFGNTSLGQSDTRGDYGDDPMEVLDRVVGEANKVQAIQETALDGVTDTQGGYIRQYKIANTLDYIRVAIAPYMQWIIFVGMTLAVILVIYNGFLMVTHTFNKEGDFAKVKKRLTYIVIGVLLLTGFYAIIKIVVGLINSTFGTGGGNDTGF